MSNRTMGVLCVLLATWILVAMLTWPVVEYAEIDLGLRNPKVVYVYAKGQP